MASNAQFEVEIYGNTQRFENSLKGINTAMSGLRGEAKNLRDALKLDPTNTDKMAQLQKNLQQQLEQSRSKATKLKQELSTVDKSTPDGQKKWLQLTRDLGKVETEANKLEKEIGDVDNAIKRGSWEIKPEMDTKSLDAGIEKTKGKFSAMREMVTGAFRQIGASAVSAIGNGLKGWVSDAMDTQKAMNALKSTMSFKGNGKEFDFVSSKMKKLAQDTNANSEDTLKLSTTFIGLGDDAKTAVSKTEALTKANQKFGGTGEQLKGVSLAYGQMAASGKVTAENMNQLTDNNTALGASLKDTVMKMNPALSKYSSFAEASEKGAVTTEMLDKAMQEMANKGGSAIQTIGDSWDAFNETMSNDVVLPVLEALTPVISSIIDKMADFGKVLSNAIKIAIDAIGKLYKSLQNSGAIDNFLEIWATLKRTFTDVAKFVWSLVKSFLGLDNQNENSKGKIEQVSDVITKLSEDVLKVVRTVSDFIHKLTESKKAMDVTKGVVVGLGFAFAGLKIAKGVVAGINAFIKLKKAITAIKTATSVAGGGLKALSGIMSLGVWGAVIAVILAVVGALVYFFTQTETGKKMWADFVKFLKDAWQGVLDFFSGLGQWFSDVWKATVDGAKNIWQGLIDWFKGVGQSIQDVFNGIGDFFSNLWQSIVDGAKSIWQGLVDFFNGIVQGIQDVFKAIGDFFSNLWQGIVDTAKNIWQSIVDFFSNLVQSIMDFFSPLIEFYKSLWNLVFSIINLVVQLILALFRGFVGILKTIWEGIVGVVQTVWNAISDVISAVIEIIKGYVQGVADFINGVWQAIYDFMKPIFQAIGDFFSQVFNGIKQVATNVWNAIVGVWQVAVQWYTNLLNGVKSVVSTAFDAIKNFASSAWQAIQGVWNAITGFFSNIFNSVKNTVSQVFGALGGFASNALNSITRVFSNVGSWFGGVFGSVKTAISNAFDSVGQIAQNAWNAITGVFSGLGQWFSDLFGGIKDIIDNVLGGISDTLDNISGIINGVSKSVSKLWKGSTVQAIGTVNLGGAGGAGMSQNSASNDNRSYNTFTINAGNQDVTTLARAIKREFETGRA